MKLDMRNVLKLKFLVFFYLGLLLVGSTIPLGIGTQSILMDNFTFDIRWDYLLHAMVYLPLPVLAFLGLRPLSTSGVIAMVLIVLCVPVLFELVQMLIPYRSFNINDMAANGVGVILGLIIVVFLSRRSRL